MAGASPCPSIGANVDEEILSSVTNKLKEALKRELEGPMEHRASYSKSDSTSAIVSLVIHIHVHVHVLFFLHVHVLVSLPFTD